MSELPEKPENAPHNCPGVSSESAGKATPCQGCPNQSLCAGGPKSPDPAIDQIKAEMSGIKKKFVVLSGKGGVGKSMVAAHLAHGLASDEKRTVSLLDVDICGPSIPTIMGMEGESIHQSANGWSQVYYSDNLGVMSIGFLLSSPDSAVIWRGPRKNALIKQFLRDVDWGNVDSLVIDTPPGTSDEHLSLVQYMNAAGLSGAIIVTTPQEVSLMDVRKEINFCHKVKLPVIGVIENMSGFICEKCSHHTAMFAATSGGAKAMCSAMNVPFLGSIPFDPVISECCDNGKSFLTEYPNSPASKALIGIIKNLLELSGVKKV